MKYCSLYNSLCHNPDIIFSFWNRNNKSRLEHSIVGKPHIIKCLILSITEHERGYAEHWLYEFAFQSESGFIMNMCGETSCHDAAVPE